MTLLRNSFKAANTILSTKRCFVVNKNNWSSENYFRSKVEVPSPPKRPLSAYMIFVKENRKGVLKENPSLKNTEQIKILAEKWSRLSEDMKKPYEVSARESTLLYGEEHKKFYESLTEEQKEEISRIKIKRLESRRNSRLKKELRASGLPNPPKSAYILFIQDEAKNKPVVKSGAEFIRKVAEMWKTLPEHTKRIYEIRADEEKTRYALEMKDWRERLRTEGKVKLLQAFDDLKGKTTELEKAAVGKKTTVKLPKETSKEDEAKSD